MKGKKYINWSELLADLQPLAVSKGVEVISMAGPWKGVRTRVVLKCPKHGEWQMTADGFKHSRLSGCQSCKKDYLKTIKKTKPEDDIKDFFKTGSFTEGTKFYPLKTEKRKSGTGSRSYWQYTCPICSNDEYVKAGLCTGKFEALADNLKKGKLSCRCGHFFFTREQWEFKIKKYFNLKGLDYKFLRWKTSSYGSGSKFIYLCKRHGEKEIAPGTLFSGITCGECGKFNQRQAYINLILDGDIEVGLKFGIAADSDNRLKTQNGRNMFKMQQVAIYLFQSVENCRDAETNCIRSLNCSILNAREMCTGWTETTSITNYDAIVKIFENYGGVRIK